ncbi:MAG: hypothetical protein SGPRY_005109, partial [Prymnesium sp.]
MVACTESKQVEEGAAARRTASCGAWQWVADPAAMPSCWEEREHVLAGRVDAERANELRYISRRRSEAEEAEVLAREEFADRRKHPDREARPAPARVRMPDGALVLGKIDISQLYNAGVYDEIRRLVRQISSGLKSAEMELSLRGEIPRVDSKLFNAWARESPFGEDEPPEQQVNGEFFRAWAARLQWQDRDMLQQVVLTGSDSRSECSRDTIIFGHHAGLWRAFAPAHKSVVMADVAACWISPGRADLWTVPARVVPKNMVGVGGELQLVDKWRLTTDDSMEVGDCVASRNAGIDPDDMGTVDLPHARSLARAILAVVQSLEAGVGIDLQEWGKESVALWALDLTNAYRMMAAARHERWLQQFVWSDDVCLDKRCEFGTAHMVELFERVITFVSEVAKWRIREFDARRPYGPARRAWQRWRRKEGLSDECSFADVYLDDGFGMTCVDGWEDCRARKGEAADVAVFTTVADGGDVRVRLVVGVTRPEIHFAIVRATFQEAGWDIAVEKVQLGWSIDLLGLALSTTNDGAVYVPELKRLGLLEDIRGVLGAAEMGGSVCRKDVEKLVGRMPHVAQVVAEGNTYLQPLYRLERARVSIGKKQKKGGGVRASARNRSGESGCAFVLTDAAREAGTGFGGFSVVRCEGESHARFYYVEQLWGQETLGRLQATAWSMPAGEMFDAVMILMAIVAVLPAVSHVIRFTDSRATARAVTSNGSGAPQLHVLAQYLSAALPG